MNKDVQPQYSLSVVSHGQGHLIKTLLGDLRSLRGGQFEILLTLNVPEDRSFLEEFSDLPIRVLENTEPKGFGANHNAAFHRSTGMYFVVINPDIRSPNFNLGAIGAVLRDGRVGACAPKVLATTGRIEDSARRFPSLRRLAARVLLRRREADYDLSDNGRQIQVDWVAGMWVAYPRTAYGAVAGFNEKYFMYLEDADICRRLRREGFEIVVDTSVSVVHDAQRASRRSLRHMSWHTRSAIRFLTGI